MKASKTTKSEVFVEKSCNRRSIFVAHRCRKRLEHVPIDPEHHNQWSETHLDVYSAHKRQPKKVSWTPKKHSQMYKTRQKVSLYFVLELKLFKIKTNLFQLSKYFKFALKNDPSHQPFTKIDACTFSRVSEPWDDLEFLLCKNTP